MGWTWWLVSALLLSWINTLDSAFNLSSAFGRIRDDFIGLATAFKGTRAYFGTQQEQEWRLSVTSECFVELASSNHWDNWVVIYEDKYAGGLSSVEAALSGAFHPYMLQEASYFCGSTRAWQGILPAVRDETATILVLTSPNMAARVIRQGRQLEWHGLRTVWVFVEMTARQHEALTDHLVPGDKVVLLRPYLHMDNLPASKILHTYIGTTTLRTEGKYIPRLGLWSGSKTINFYQWGLEQRELKITTMDYEPFTIIHTDSQGRRTYSGICFEIINTMKDLLNFTYTVVDPVDESYGIIDEDGNWTGMIGMVHRHEIDIVVGPISVTQERAGAVDFLMPFHEEPVGLMLRVPQTNSVLALARPFNRGVWLALGGALVATTFAIWAMAKMLPRECKEEVYFTKIANALFFSHGAMFQQGSVFYPRQSSVRLVIEAWALFVLVITATYSGNLIAFFAVNKSTLTINSLEELANSKYSIVTEKGTALHQLLMGADNGIYKRLWDKMKHDPRSVIESDEDEDIDPGLLKRLLTEDVVFLEETTWLEYLASTRCQLTLADDKFFKTNLAFPVSKDFPYLRLFNKVMLQIFQSGLLDRWRQKYWSGTKSCRLRKTSISNAEGATQADTQGAFYILAMGIGVAFLVFITEMVLRYIRHHKKKHEKKKEDVHIGTLSALNSAIGNSTLANARSLSLPNVSPSHISEYQWNTL